MKLTSVKAKLPKSVKSITILKPKEDGSLVGGTDRVVVKQKSSRKRQSKGIVRVWERLVRRAAKANNVYSNNYLERHNRSSRKRRDGWLRDLNTNVMRAQRKGAKEIKLSKIFR